MAALHDHLDQQTSPDIMPIDFMEVAPENWIGVGGRFGKQFRSFTERFPFACHGLSLSIGGTTPIDIEFVKSVKNFLDTHGIEIYSEHLSFCSDHGHLYDLMPIPFTEDSVKYVAERIMQVQDILGRRLIIENVSAYLEPGKMMSEPDFVRAVVELSDCDLLLDVNNVYVNSVNHGYTPKDYIDLMPTERIRYYHVAGHYVEKDNLLIDTHGAPVIDPVWDLLNHAYDRHGVKATLLERDFNYSDLDQLGDELHTIKKIQNHQLSAKSDLIGIKDYG
ncbi:MAG: DUF692 domain-containing protein [Oleibacter sp.]|nr:DUF692 domain-containing protein [Thalassolituus sp.]